MEAADDAAADVPEAAARSQPAPAVVEPPAPSPGSPPRSNSSSKLSWRDKLNAKLGKPAAASPEAAEPEVNTDGKPLSKQEQQLLKLKQKLEAEELARKKAAEVAEAVGECYQVERTNMLNMVKIGIKTLIESSIGFGALGESHHALTQFCLLAEQILGHGIKEGKSIREKYATRKGLWGMLESFEAANPAAAAVCHEVRAIPLLKTNMGRVRAWIRLALQHKTFPDILRELVGAETMLHEWYQPWSVMVADESMVFAGLLVSLNTIEYKFDIDPFMLDGLPPVLDYSMYLRDGNYLRQGTGTTEEAAPSHASGAADGRFSESSFIQLQNQKSEVEERNRIIAAELATLQATHSATAAALGPMEGKLATCTAKIEVLESEKVQAATAMKALEDEFSKRLQTQTSDIATERQTYEQSREGLNEMYDVMQKQLDTERALREDVETELNKLLATRKELEGKIAGHEAELERRQDIMAALRTQLKEVKELNLTMLTNVQDAQLKVRDAEDAQRKSEKSIAGFTAEQQDMSVRFQESSKKRQQLESTILELSSRLQDVDAQRAAMETNLSIERQYRSTLQANFDEEKRKMVEMTKVETAFETLQKDFTLLQVAHEELKLKNAEAEQTLVEMGSQFSEEKLKLNEMELKRKAAAKSTWQDNTEASNCKLCTNSFSLTRRRHHCRNCGGIFCNDCSDNKMPLASSAKAVRVCDTCQSELLKQMSL